MNQELAKLIFRYLDGKQLARTREVSRKWNEFASEESLWKALCLKKCESLETDEHLWAFISRDIGRNSPNAWRKIYPQVQRSPVWKCRLGKTEIFFCNLAAHELPIGSPLGELGFPSSLNVQRRFHLMHLKGLVMPDASVVYLIPERDADRAGYTNFIEYLATRERAGIVQEDQRRFLLIPPCEYSRTALGYHGKCLLGVVQRAYPMLARDYESNKVERWIARLE